MKNKFFAILPTLLFFSFSACDADYSSMLEEFNSKFVYSGEPRQFTKIGDPGFKQGDMIPEFSYYMSFYSELTLIAPEGNSSYGAVSYHWEVLQDEVVLQSEDQRNITIFFDSTYRAGVEYSVTLTAKNKAGTYTDSAKIYVDNL